MAGRRVEPSPSRKPFRLHDSGFASDGDSVPSSKPQASPVDSSPPVRTLEVPTFRHTDWNFGTLKSRYAKDELQLKQPKGFPVIPLASTLTRAREDAEAEAADRGYSGPDFAIYEDTGEVDDALSDLCEMVVAAESTKDKSSTVIDSRGRTRAATKRLGLGGATTLSEEKVKAARECKKRKRGGTQAAKQPRKQAKKDT